MPSQPSHLHLVGVGRSDRLQELHDDPIAFFEVEHVWKLALCDALELIADGLPHSTNEALCRMAVSVLTTALPRHASLEEQLLFPMLRRSSSIGSDCERVLVELEQEHASDEPFAHEIAEALEELGQGARPRNSEMLGYMLRGFFVPLRRHVEWEDVTILPLARRVLSREDKAQLAASLVEARQQTDTIFNSISAAVAEARRRAADEASRGTH